MTINDIMDEHNKREAYFAGKTIVKHTGRAVKPIKQVKLKKVKPVKVPKVRKPREDKGKPRAKYAPGLPLKYRQYLGRANQKGKAFTLSVEEFNHLLSRQCVYCGSGSRMTIDRVDSSLGYIQDNCVPACFTCNVMKYTADKDEFLAHVVKIYRFNFSR